MDHLLGLIWIENVTAINGWCLQIRYYTPEDRGPISDVNSEVWPAAFIKVSQQLLVF